MVPFGPEGRVRDCKDTFGLPRMGITWLWRGANVLDVFRCKSIPLWRRASIMAEGDFMPREEKPRVPCFVGDEGPAASAISSIEDDSFPVDLLVMELLLLIVSLKGFLGEAAASESEVVSLPSMEAVGVRGGVARVET